jgi:hypothetical protein
MLVSLPLKLITDSAIYGLHYTKIREKVVNSTSKIPKKLGGGARETVRGDSVGADRD